MTQKTTSTETGTSLFIQTNSAAVRIWHWLTFLVVTALIVTALMASTVLNPRENIPVVQNILKDRGVVVSNDQTFAVTHMYDDKMWELHKLLGYALAFLFLSRIAIELTQPKEERISFRLKKARMALKQALSLIHISEPTRRTPISYAVFCLKKKK